MRSVVKQPRYSDLKIPGVGHAHFSDLAFRIRSAISVRSTGLSRFDRHTTMSSEIRHVWTPGVRELLHQAKGYRCTSVQYPLYFGLVNWTLAYFHKFPPSTCCNMDYRDISLPDSGIFRIRSAISVRSTGLSRFDRQTTMSSEIRHVWTPVLADCYTRPRGAVVLRSSTPCTLAYLTELWPTFTNFRPPLVLTLATMLFRLFLVGYIEKSGYER
jgi:hypothetical protein